MIWRWAWILWFWGALVSAQQIDSREMIEAQKTLKDLGATLSAVELTVERYEIGRLLYLEGLVKTVQDSISSKGLGHSATFRAYQTLVISFNHSSEYFKRIETVSTKDTIKHLSLFIAKIVEARGIDESPSLITNSVFVQMEKLFRDLLKIEITPQLRSSLTDFIPRIGEVTAKSSKGDWADVYDISRPLALDLRGLYPLMDKVKKDKPGYAMILNIQGLIEFYVEFSRAENIRSTN